MNEIRELGLQPLEGLMIRLKLTSHDLVVASADQLTHKMVAKGRKGRKLTKNAQKKILSAFNALSSGDRLTLEDLCLTYG